MEFLKAVAQLENVWLQLPLSGIAVTIVVLSFD